VHLLESLTVTSDLTNIHVNQSISSTCITVFKYLRFHSPHYNAKTLFSNLSTVAIDDLRVVLPSLQLPLQLTVSAENVTIRSLCLMS